MMATVRGTAGDNPPDLRMLAITLRYAVFALARHRRARASPCSGWPRVAVDPALVLPLGIAAAAAAYWLSLVAGRALVCPRCSIAASTVAACSPCAGPGAWPTGPPLRGAVAPVAGHRRAARGDAVRREPRRPRPASSCSTPRALRHRLPRRPHPRADPRLSAAGARGVRASRSATTSGPTSCARPRCAGRRSIPTTRSTAST